MYCIGARIRRPRLLVVYVRYWSRDRTTTSLGSVCTVLEHRLDDHICSKCMYDIGAGIDGHVSCYCMSGIGAPTRRPRLLVVYELYWNMDKTTTSLDSVYTVLDYGLDGHVSC